MRLGLSLGLPTLITMSLLGAACKAPARDAPTGNGGGGGTSITGAGGHAGNTGGSGGTAHDAGVDAGPSRGPTPAANGVNFPFPQNRQASGCSYPTGYLNSDVAAAYQQWKTDTVTSTGAGGFLRVQRLATDLVDASRPLNSTVSEGIAYGMLIAVYMGDQTVFDGLWKYEQAHLDMNGLMNWAIDASGNTTGTGAATDADEDMAFALVMADRQWGGKGSLSTTYLDAAKTQIQAFWNNDIYQSKLPRNGDGWGDWNDLNISYFAPAYYRVFKAIDGNAAWDDVIKTVYDTITNALAAGQGNATNGLVPAWCTSMGAAVGGQPYNYQYDSCRVPFRIGMDWCLFGETRAHDYVAKTSGFFSGVGVANIVDGYNLDGTQSSGTNPVTVGQSAAFIGPAGVGAMSAATYQSFLNDAYAKVATRTLMVGGRYYDESWTVMSLLMMTGNFLDYTALTPAH
jgi:endo-1,4-beta-D-glucanase Y